MFIPSGPKRLLKTQTFEKKKANLPVKKYIGQFFSRIIELDKPEETTYKGPKCILTLIVQVIRQFHQD